MIISNLGVTISRDSEIFIPNGEPDPVWQRGGFTAETGVGGMLGATFAPTLGYNGRFVAVGRGATSSHSGYNYSDDGGVTWSGGQFTGKTLYNVCFGNGLLAAVGIKGNQVYTSTDGASWTSNSVVGASSTYILKDIIYSADAGKFLAVGEESVYPDRFPVYVSSIDGVLWSANSMHGRAYQMDMDGVAYNPDLGLYIACGKDRGNNRESYCTSTDGTTWTPPISVYGVDGSGLGWVTVTYADGLFVMGGARLPAELQRKPIFSENGTDWNLDASMPVTSDLAPTNIEYNNGAWFGSIDGSIGLISCDRCHSWRFLSGYNTNPFGRNPIAVGNKRCVNVFFNSFNTSRFLDVGP